MPTYSYVCEACNKEWEEDQRISDTPTKDCPKCGEPKAKRQIGSSGFILRGPGWFKSGGY